MQCNSIKSVVEIDKRRAELLELSSYIQTVDNDVTMILQSLQWDRKHLIETSPLISCKYDRNHRVPPDKMQAHEKQCYLRTLGYSKEDMLLPEPFDANAKTLVTLSKIDIQNVIEYAAKVDPTFKKGKMTRSISRGSKDPSEPLTLEHLQHTYSADERRALHEAVVSAAPSCHDLSGLALLSGDGETQNTKPKSRAEIIAELRDMKRRRAKYRGAVKTRNYSDELRSVIATQMEHYSEALGASTKSNFDINKSNIERPKDFKEIQVKKEPLESDRPYTSEREIKSSKKFDRLLEKFKYDTKEKSKDNNRREKSRDDTRYKDNYRDDRHSDRREKHTEKEKYDDYRRDRDTRRRKDDRDRYSSSSKDRCEYRNDKYDASKRNYNDNKPSRNSERRYKEKYDSREKYKEEKHKRYYDYKQEYDLANKRIKQEKTE